MGIEILEETTVWEDNTPNHIYAVKDGTKLVAYRRNGLEKWEMFSKPLSFSKTRRKFRKIKDPLSPILQELYI
jgi:hypothetical protein